MENNKKLLLFGVSFIALFAFLVFSNESHQLRKELIQQALQERSLMENIALLSANISGEADSQKSPQKRNFLLCADSDGGIVSDIRGTISLSYTFSSGKTKVRKFSDLNLRHKGVTGIAEFYCEGNHPKVKFIECERESKGVCVSTPKEEKALIDISAGISSNGSDYAKRVTITPEDSYASVNTPVYYKVVIDNLSETLSANTTMTYVLLEEAEDVLGTVQNEEIVCPEGTTCKGSLADGITIEELYPSESVIITYERDINNSSATEPLWIEKYQLDTGSSDAVTLQIKK